jgi:hypothetical protein
LKREILEALFGAVPAIKGSNNPVEERRDTLDPKVFFDAFPDPAEVQ